MKKRKKDKWIQGDSKHEGAVRHPGALKAAAHRHGVTTKQEAEKESHSSNPKIRSRGNLGKRFLGTAKHGNLRNTKHHKGKARKRVSGKA